ncbi:MAG: preprotein translocase subunit YajC [Anaerofustis stercorihominis]|nr:preprotein translocase subunit YajC [Anaerofustis stercorihominis]
MFNILNSVVAEEFSLLTAMKNMGSLLIWFVPVFVLQYFTMIRPQQKKAKEYEALVNEIMKGDKILTSSGFYGTVTHLEEETVVVELEPAKVRLKLHRNCILNVIEHGEARKNTKIIVDENNNFVKVGAPEDNEEYNPEDDVYNKDEE